MTVDERVVTEKTRAFFSWPRLVVWAPIAIAVNFLAVMLIFAEFDPFLVVITAIPLIAGYVGYRFPRRAGPITVLVVLTLLVLMNIQPLIEDLAHPESLVNFLPFAVIPLTLALLGIIAAIAVLTSWSVPAPSFSYTALAVIAVGAVVSIAAAAGLEDDAIVAGDLEVIAEDVEFSPESLSGSGSVGVFIDNQDPVRHTFTIKELDVDVELPANTARRVDITAAPGSYEYVCTVPGHEDMKGTLTIGG